jgi:hypothetical protein
VQRLTLLVLQFKRVLALLQSLLNVVGPKLGSWRALVHKLQQVGVWRKWSLALGWGKGRQEEVEVEVEAERRRR